MSTSINIINKKPIIIVIDDNPLVTSAFRRQLKDNFQVISANDGRTGCTLISAIQNIDLVVLDVTMPEYDAVEVLQYLNSIDIKPRIILVSGWIYEILENVADMARAMKFEVLGVYEKPINIAEMISDLSCYKLPDVKTG